MRRRRCRWRRNSSSRWPGEKQNRQVGKIAMVGLFTARRSSVPEPAVVEEPASAALEGVSWTVFPEPAAEPAAPPPPANPLLSDKLLDAKVRLHRRLIEEVNLSALEKLSEEEIHRHVTQLVTQYILVERLALNTEEL